MASLTRDPTRPAKIALNLTRDPTQPDPARSADGPDPCPSLAPTKVRMNGVERD